MLALLFSAIVLLSLTLTSTAASALPTCVELGSDPAFGLVGNPDLSGVSTSLVPAAGPNAAYCQMNITVSSESGEAFGYLPRQPEHIRAPVGLPLSLADGGTGGVQGAWNGQQRNLGGGRYVRAGGGVTAATRRRRGGHAAAASRLPSSRRFPPPPTPPAMPSRASWRGSFMILVAAFTMRRRSSAPAPWETRRTASRRRKRRRSTKSGTDR